MSNTNTNDWLDQIKTHFTVAETGKVTFALLDEQSKQAIRAHIAANYVEKDELEGEYMRGCADQSRISESELQERLAAERAEAIKSIGEPMFDEFFEGKLPTPEEHAWIVKTIKWYKDRVASLTTNSRKEGKS